MANVNKMYPTALISCPPGWTLTTDVTYASGDNLTGMEMKAVGLDYTTPMAIEEVSHEDFPTGVLPFCRVIFHNPNATMVYVTITLYTNGPEPAPAPTNPANGIPRPHR
jgi:hypothetical protein